MTAPLRVAPLRVAIGLGSGRKAGCFQLRNVFHGAAGGASLMGFENHGEGAVPGLAGLTDGEHRRVLRHLISSSSKVL